MKGRRTNWCTVGLSEYAQNHTIRECAVKFNCSYIAIQHYLLRHAIKYKQAEKGVKREKHYAYKHGETRTRLYRIWTYMKRRCFDPKDKDFSNYGARGITVCKEWSESYIAFRSWALHNGYAKNLTLDRINFNEDYSSTNCRWVTAKEQNNNKRSNRFVTYNGITLTVAQWAERLGLERHALLYRLNNWTVKEAFEKSLQRR